jgi:two-component system chemotaxis response regulator CheY
MSESESAVSTETVSAKTTKTTKKMRNFVKESLKDIEKSERELKIEALEDLVFLDINMPLMNGMEFMRELIKNDALKSTPVVVVSTEGSKGRRDELDELQVKAFIRKPVTPEVLSQTVLEILGDKL